MSVPDRHSHEKSGRAVLLWAPDDRLSVKLLASYEKSNPEDSSLISPNLGRYVRARTCRRQFLLAYFGETAPARCGRCDRCLARPDGLVTPADEPLLAALLGHVERGDAPAAWLPDVAGPKREALVDWLVHEGLLKAEDPLAERYRLTPKGLRFAQRVGG